MRVFVHGVPETAVVWNPLREAVKGPSEALTLPGFGTALPPGFTPTKDRYAAWLTDELRKFPEPVDLVGHDWGALLTLRVATAGEVPLRSWVCDVGGVFHPDYAWHPWAAALISDQGEETLRLRRESSPEEAGRRPGG
ncbi:Alpha/beta hydrolase family protein [Nonomuraea maritima]|uniref:Alpha/beta hydrolase family protein n=1 Tax=Nonomuraea maritima TaxID=683260 RepID=A0A1G9EJ81_9ACTN|nr:alpha/beta hydrolase [Nonomuraea maritima]SDK76212.1 Alpha/beta hydrolase family protein [Nonomuraea maritima]